MRRTTLGRDSFGTPFPIPASVYDKIRNESIRPLLAMALWNVDPANDPSLLAIAHAVALRFLQASDDRA